jgi:hypothetical protein
MYILDDDGQTPSDLARSFNHNDVAILLRYFERSNPIDIHHSSLKLKQTKVFISKLILQELL